MTFRELWSLFAEMFLDCVKIFVSEKLPWSRNILACWKLLSLQKIFLIKVKSVCPWFSKFFSGKFHWLWKTFLFVEHFLNQVRFSCGKRPWLWKFSWLWKTSLTVEKVHVCRKFPWLWKKSLIKENFLDCGKVSWSKKNWLQKKS